jgi:hypothetical protein
MIVCGKIKEQSLNHSGIGGGRRKESEKVDQKRSEGQSQKRGKIKSVDKGCSAKKFRDSTEFANFE